MAAMYSCVEQYPVDYHCEYSTPYDASKDICRQTSPDHPSAADISTIAKEGKRYATRVEAIIAIRPMKKFKYVQGTERAYR